MYSTVHIATDIPDEIIPCAGVDYIIAVTNYYPIVAATRCDIEALETGKIDAPLIGLAIGGLNSAKVATRSRLLSEQSVVTKEVINDIAGDIGIIDDEQVVTRAARNRVEAVGGLEAVIASAKADGIVQRQLRSDDLVIARARDQLDKLLKVGPVAGSAESTGLEVPVDRSAQG